MDKLEQIKKAVEIAIAADVHAFALIVMGCIVSIKQHELGTGMVMTGLGIFKGK